MRRLRFDLQVLVVIIFVAVIFFAALMIRVVENPLGIFSEPNELLLYCDDLQGLRERAELRSRGAIVGHIKKIEWGTPERVLGEVELVNAEGSAAAPVGERFWIKAGITDKYKQWRFAPQGQIRGAVMQSAMTPSWIELLPPPTAAQAVAAGPETVIELLPEKQKPGAEGLVQKVSEVGDAILELVRVINPPGPAKPGATPPVQKIVKMIDDMSETSRTMLEFAQRVKEKSTDDELHKALQELKGAIAKLNEHVTEADGAIEETTDAMRQFRKAAKATEEGASKFNDLVDRVGDTTMGRILIRKKKATPSSTPRGR